MDLNHIDPGNNETGTLQTQCPICFKTSTVIQGMGVIASRALLPSSDVEGQCRKHTYCPSTFNTADSYNTPALYSDQVAQHGAPTFLHTNVSFQSSAIWATRIRNMLNVHVLLHQVQWQLAWSFR